MTVEQLKDEVCALGFEAQLDDNAHFILSANRALRLIFSERGVMGCAHIIVSAPERSFYINEYIHKPESPASFTVEGVALSFKVSGRGAFRLTSGGVSITEEFDTDYGVIRKFIDREATLRFLGQLSFTVRDITGFSRITSAEESKIPVYAEKRTVELSRLIGDLFSLAKPPEDCHGKPIEGATIRGGSLLLPYDFSGEVILFYKRLPRTVHADDTEDIDIPAECAHLLPLLVASYIWLDDDGDKARYYMQLYKEAMALIKRYEPLSIDSGFTDVLGWC